MNISPNLRVTGKASGVSCSIYTRGSRNILSLVVGPLKKTFFSGFPLKKWIYLFTEDTRGIKNLKEEIEIKRNDNGFLLLNFNIYVEDMMCQYNKRSRKKRTFFSVPTSKRRGLGEA